MSLLIKQQKVKKIAVFRARRLNSMLGLMPAVRALRAAYPKAQITLIGLPCAATLLRRFPGYFNNFIHFPGYPGLPEQPFDDMGFVDFTLQMQEEQFDLLLQMHDNGTIVNKFLAGMQAKYLAGFADAGNQQNNSLFIKYTEELPEMHRHLALMNALGIPADNDALEFPALPADTTEVRSLCLPVMEKSYVVVHPGSGDASWLWPPQCFALLADYCIEKGYTVLITGAVNEKDITTEVMKCMRHPAIDLTGKTTVGALALLIRESSMLITDSTGIAQIAAATQTPGIIISKDGEPERWSAPNTEWLRLTNWSARPNLEQVLQATSELLEQAAVSVA